MISNSLAKKLAHIFESIHVLCISCYGYNNQKSQVCLLVWLTINSRYTLVSLVHMEITHLHKFSWILWLLPTKNYVIYITSKILTSWLVLLTSILHSFQSVTNWSAHNGFVEVSTSNYSSRPPVLIIRKYPYLFRAAKK